MTERILINAQIFIFTGSILEICRENRIKQKEN